MTRVLVRLPNWVGDICLALPALDGLRAAWPEATLVAMARPGHRALVERLTVVDEVIEAPASRGPGGVWRGVRQLSARPVEAAVLLAPSFEAALTAWLARIPVRVGWATDHRASLLTMAVPEPDGHRGDGFQALVSALGRPDAPPSASSPPPPASAGAGGLSWRAPDRDYADRLLTVAGLGPGSDPIFLNPASAKAARSWSAARYRELAEQLVAAGHGPVLVHVQPPFDPPPGWPSRPGIHLVRGASLVELGALLARCRAYVGNDSGPMHLAAVQGVATVAIYGPSTPARTAPRGADHRAVSARFACSPCRERFYEECPDAPTAAGQPPCLDAVATDQVVRTTADLLQAPR